MINRNRRKERLPEMIDFLNSMYEPGPDFTGFEAENRALESNGSLAQDRINQKVYSSLSRRTDAGLVKKWAREMNYEPVIFETQSHAGQPVYHVDIVIFVGTGYSGIFTDALLPEYRRPVLDSLCANLEVVELSMEQMKRFAGNSLEITCEGGEKILAMSETAYRSLRQDQVDTYLKHVSKIVHPDIPTLETYGGGSVRCMIQELF